MRSWLNRLLVVGLIALATPAFAQSRVDQLSAGAAVSGTNAIANCQACGAATDLVKTTFAQILTYIQANIVVPLGANPTATAGASAINGSAATFMRSDGAPPVAKASNSAFGIVEVDGTSIIAAGGVISATGGGGGGVTCSGCTTTVLPVTTGTGTLGDSAFQDTSTPGNTTITATDSAGIFSTNPGVIITASAGNGPELALTPQGVTGGVSGGAEFAGFGSAPGSGYIYADGTPAVPTKIGSGSPEQISNSSSFGYDGSTYQLASRIETWTAGDFSVTPAATLLFRVVPDLAAGLNSAGEFVIGAVAALQDNNASASLISAQLIWNVGENPNGKIIYTADRAERVTKVLGRAGAINALSSTVKIQKIPSGTAPGSGTDLTSSTFNAATNANINQILTLSATPADDLLAPGDSLVVITTGTWALSNGGITVHMVPN